MISTTRTELLSPLLRVPCVLQAATVHGIAPRPDSVVIRTRFDVFFDRPYDLTGLRAYFLAGPRGRHLILAQEVCNAAQSDIQLVTSWGCYAEDIALALHTGDSWGLDNGWGYGALQQPPAVVHINGTIASGVHETDDGCFARGWSAVETARRHNHVLPRSTCGYVTVVEVPHILLNIRHHDSGGIVKAPPRKPMRPPDARNTVELSEGVSSLSHPRRASDHMPHAPRLCAC